MNCKSQFFVFLSTITILCSSAYALDIANISNPANYTQQYRTQTYTIGSDGVSLFYRKANTGMKLNTPALQGGKIAVTDPSLQPRQRGGGGGGNGMNGAKVAKGVGAALAVASGGYMIYDATKGKEKHNVGRLLEGIAGGAIGGAAFGGWTAAIGAAVGGAIAGSQLFSETDCLTDPVTGEFTCCNTAFNKGERYAEIGDYMFCAGEDDQPYAFGVRQCLQGGSATKDTWWNGLWKDDAWSPGFCQQRFCDGENAPANGLDSYLVAIADIDYYCWRWDCIEGYTKSGNNCIENATGAPVGTITPTSSTGDGTTSYVDPYDTVINKINQLRQQIIDECGTNL